MQSASKLPALILLFLFGGRAIAADAFPAISQLPSQPGLPDPLLMFNGERVTNKKEWVNKRRPELKALFQHYMYGHMPPPPKIESTIERVDKHFFGGKATMKEVTIAFDPPDAPRIHLLLMVPNERKKAAPVFVGLNFCGNHALVADPTVRVPAGWMYANYPGVTNNHATEAGRGTQVDVWAIEQSIDRGYAVATFYSGDLEPDRPDAPEGIRACYAHRSTSGRQSTHLGSPGTSSSDWGTIIAWAWGVHRAVDYLQTDKDIDHKRISVVGHSRNGKAALVAAAFDERIALAIPLQAGCGGTAPSRGKTGESVKQINDRFPHWFNAEFKQFNEQPERLPVDQHCLIALCAPRPVLLPNALEDTWANPAGQFEMLQAADPVYRLLKAGGLEAKQMPEPGKLIDSALGFYIRPGKHSMTKEDWKVFCDFADKHLGAARRY